MSNRDIGAEILDGINEIRKFKKEEIQLKITELSEPSSPNNSGTGTSVPAKRQTNAAKAAFPVNY